MSKVMLFDTWGTLVDNYSIADVIEPYVFESHTAQNVAQDWRFQQKWAMFHLTLSDNCAELMAIDFASPGPEYQFCVTILSQTCGETA